MRLNSFQPCIPCFSIIEVIPTSNKFFIEFFYPSYDVRNAFISSLNRNDGIVLSDLI